MKYKVKKHKFLHNQISVPNIGISMSKKAHINPGQTNIFSSFSPLVDTVFLWAYLFHNWGTVNVESNDPSALILMNNFSLLVNSNLLPKFSDETHLVSLTVFPLFCCNFEIYFHVAFFDVASIIFEK